MGRRLTVAHGAVSDVGFRRPMNQDSYVVQRAVDDAQWHRIGDLFLVADGMGGHAVGELASKMAVDTVPLNFSKSREADPRTALRQAIRTANAAIHERGQANADFHDMGTTCSALVLSARGALVGHVGDSRVYRVRGDRIDQLTFDHSLQWELMRRKKVSLEEVQKTEPRHVITRCLGPEPDVEVDVEGPYPVRPGDAFVLCSDGLTGHVEDAEIGQIAGSLPPDAAAQLLVHLANLRGGTDNITVLVAQVGTEPVPRDGSHDGAAPASDAAHAGDGPKNGPTRFEWGAIFGSAAVFGIGLSVALFGNLISGVVVCLAALIACSAVLGRLAWRRRNSSAERSDTRVWRPYRSAPARLAKKLLTHLASVEAELRRTVAGENWPYDAARVSEDRAVAERAAEAGDLSTALAAYARAIDALMTAVHQYRRNRRTTARESAAAPEA